MKHKKLTAALLALSIMLSACSGKTTEETKKNETSENVTTEETGSETEETEEPTETTLANPSFSVKTQKFFDDPYSFYSSDDYVMEVIVAFSLSADEIGEIYFAVTPGMNQYMGTYEEEIEGTSDPIEVRKCDFTGSSSGLTRLNDYSFQFSMDKPVCENFDEYDDEDWRGNARHVSFGEPKKLANPEQMILYLPNTPLSELPDEVKGVLRIIDPDFAGDHLQNFMLYSVNDAEVFFVSGTGIPETIKPTANDMDNWVGEYTSQKGADLSIELDSTTGIYVMNGTIEGTVNFADAPILMNAHDQGELFIYCENSFVTAIVEIDMIEDNPLVYVIYTSDESYISTTIHTYLIKEN
ncbi:MAG: hypothetical protein J6Y08_07565 [Clostridiales bacterium]|nr:hypothetical protein [Clostridiales bacterium]